MIEQATPKIFDEYIGQTKAKEILQTVLNSTKQQMRNILAKNNQEAFNEAAMLMPPSILIIGPPGYGKTRLAQIYASQMYQLSKSEDWPQWASDNQNYGKEVWNGIGLPNEPYFFAATEGKDLSTAKILDHYFFYLQVQGVLFIDECQTIPEKMHEYFLRIMTEQKYQSKIANKLIDHFGFTLIGATTHEGKLFRPFLERFKLIITLENYTEKELSDMILQYCNKLDYNIEANALQLLISRSRDNPRTITQNLDMFLMIKGFESHNISLADAQKATELRGIGDYGLMSRDIQILKTLEEHSPLGAEVLCTIIDAVDIDNYKAWERYLINKGYIIPTRAGRILTEKGRKILKEI